MTHICVMSSHKPIRIYMQGLILGVNTLYRHYTRQVKAVGLYGEISGP